jgi:peptidoglycan hydrolase-like protein with peptidoglycan-binding domain
MESTRANKRFRFLALAAAVALALPAGATAAQITGGTSSPGGGSGSADGGAGSGSSSSKSSGGSAGSSGGATATGTSGGTTTGGGTAKKPTSTSQAKGKSKPKVKKTPAQPAVTISGARCVPASSCDTKEHEVSTHGTLLLQGKDLESGQAVAFPHSWEARIADNSPTAHLHSSKLGLVVTVPSSAHSGEIAVMLGRGRKSNLFGPIKVVTHALHPPAPPKPAPPAPVPDSVASTANGTALAGQGMWIWYLSASDGGNLASIAAQAKAAGVGTLLIKSSDGSTNYWSQFGKTLVEEVHAQGLKVCAWQYVYGTNPVGEAELGAKAVAEGAECLVIDAEAQYEGLYGAAQTYIDTLRAKIGPAYPLALASFPYVNYHPSFPYSVFLGPGGAQFDVPQMYWHDIGTSVAQVYINTYEQNLIYGRPILPLGQTYGGVSSSEIVAFRSLASAYGAAGDSFWDWQETKAAGWTSMVAPLNTALTVPQPELTSPLLKEGAKSDQVLWLQEHLAGAIPTQPTTGIFESQTATNVREIQTEHGLPATGETDAATWGYILALPMVAVNWTGAGPKT